MERPQRLLVLVGIECSGKTSLATSLQDQGWVVVPHGSLNIVLAQCCQELRKGREVVVDRLGNYSRAERKKFVALARQSQGAIAALACTLHTAFHVCAERVCQKRGLLNAKQAEVHLDRQQRNFQPVDQEAEGFAQVFDLHRQADMDAFPPRMGPGRVLPEPPLPAIKPKHKDTQRRKAGKQKAVAESNSQADGRPGLQHSMARGSAPDVDPSFQWAEPVQPLQATIGAGRNWWDAALPSHPDAASQPFRPPPGDSHPSQGAPHVQIQPDDITRQPGMHVAVRHDGRSFADSFWPAEGAGQSPTQLHISSTSLPPSSQPPLHAQPAPQVMPNGVASPHPESPRISNSPATHAPPQPSSRPVPDARQSFSSVPPTALLLQPSRQALGGGPRRPSTLSVPATQLQPHHASHHEHGSQFPVPELPAGLQLPNGVQRPVPFRPMPFHEASPHNSLDAPAAAHAPPHHHPHNALPPQQQRPAAPRASHEQSDAQPSKRRRVAETGVLAPPGDSAQALPPEANNIVPLPLAGRLREPLPIDESDPRPILLFDLNGTLTQHTAARRSSGRNVMRPGTSHLLRLQGAFRLGIFSSASPYTVSNVVPMLRAAAGPSDTPLFGDPALNFDRRCTEEAPAAHRAAGGKAWDTVKPLGRIFQRLGRVLLVDDDAFKSIAGEEANMVLVPCWVNEDPSDSCIPVLVDTLLDVLGPLGPDADLRLNSLSISQRVLAAAGSQPATVSAQHEGLVSLHRSCPAREECEGGADGACKIAVKAHAVENVPGQYEPSHAAGEILTNIVLGEALENGAFVGASSSDEEPGAPIA